MRVLITGANGQVGSALVHRLRGFGSLIAADRSLLDLSQPQDIGSRLDALRPDLIINPAAYTAVDRAEDEAALAYTVNATAPEALARWASPRNVPLIHFSTDYVFDGSGERPWSEEDPAAPLNVYGASKLAGEEAVRSTAATSLIIRTAWIYAASGRNFLRTIAKLATEREELRIVDDQIGAPTPAAFVADVLASILERRGADLPKTFDMLNHCLHLTAGGQTSWHGFATAIVSGLKRRGVPVVTRRVVPISTAEYPAKAKRPLNSRFDITRLQSALHIAPPDWRDLLEAELDCVASVAG
jgi:dTDP-4-dehydrorhamnose reductase